ncbi:tripartite tricarboxylate transporter permease [Photobacterium rosenbergii]|uniref:tripartite tricarboxylate transporter permease n=1 Tax=Photobacterium rosenbergii TaxID=294936 RepID=UPI001C99631D|nr:tripartite tricarboxylate transporter permease [Photobacterium rosenbergii]MBY5944639.1 tripartite tricarboxylate transporter permease [Photobacterium rosenbergii]
MFDTLFLALAEVFQPQSMLYMLAGVLMGLAVGVFPGLGGIVGLSLLLPFLYGMDTVPALAMLIGLVAVIPTSDTFTSVLMGIPGSSASQATVLDGFPMAKKGQAARALGAAFSASLFGGVFGALILTVFVLVARPLILSLGSAELFMLAILGLSMVGVLAGNSISKGLMACGLGLLLGSVGSAPATGEERMTLGMFYLYDGLPLVVVALGIFAFPEIIYLLRQGGAISQGELRSGWVQGIRDMWLYRWLCVRCASIGAMIGAIPGLGGNVVDWIAYGHVKQSAKDNSEFGKGDVRGVLAPESANNAKEGGGLIPTLLFGIPGSGSMAVFLGGMVLIGIEPGPSMVSDNLGLTYTIVWSLAIANIFGAGLCLLFSRQVAKLTTIPYALMAPFMLVVISFAAFQATRDISDLLTLFAVGILGLAMKRFEWPRPAFLIGFVLAGNIETYLYQAMQFYGAEMFLRPGTIIIALLTAASLWFSFKKQPKPEISQASTKISTEQKLFTAVILIFFIWAGYEALQLSLLGGVFGGIVSLAMIIAMAWHLWRLGRTQTAAVELQDLENDNQYQRSFYYYLWWFGGFAGTVILAGFLPAVTLFYITFLRKEANASWTRTAVLTGLTLGVLETMSYVMVLEYPSGVVGEQFLTLVQHSMGW